MLPAVEKFGGVFEHLVEDLRQHCVAQDKLPDQVWNWFEKSLKYNVIGGKYNRGLSVIDTTRILLGRDLSEEEYFHAATLGWMTELLQAMFLVLDDVMDASTSRRGQPCWYLVPDVGMIAVNDAPMLESAIYILLKKHFRSHTAYVDMLEIFHEVACQVEVGQTYDMIAAKRDLNSFDIDTYLGIVTYKTSYYSFYLPVALAMLYTGRSSPNNLTQARDILLAMGTYFQIQDDYLDNFADPEVLGKVGTDIQDGKCSWLVVQALRLCNEEQLAVLQENYGKKDASCEKRIKELYDELQLDGIYQTYEETAVAEIEGLISNVDEKDGLKKDVFVAFLNKIQKRSK
ncbi:ERG20 farnesyl diphosphate synthase [Nemania abortiva]|nr:ERG20 farnesyl diphosphate synthase [Nemania abortiva]